MPAIAGKCGKQLHLLWTGGMPVYLSSVVADFDISNCWGTTWRVECEDGHVLLFPADTGREIDKVGVCDCDYLDDKLPDHTDDCSYWDLARLRAVLGLPGAERVNPRAALHSVPPTAE